MSSGTRILFEVCDTRSLTPCPHVPPCHNVIFCSQIRETLVEMMARPATEQPSGSMLHWVEQGQFDTIASQGSSSSPASEGNELPTDPPACILWCAVALGALVQGNPVESVRRCTFIVNPAKHRRGLPFLLLNALVLGLVLAWYHH